MQSAFQGQLRSEGLKGRHARAAGNQQGSAPLAQLQSGGGLAGQGRGRHYSPKSEEPSNP